MNTMKDTKARLVAVVALVAALGAYTLGAAQADSLSEPDAYAVKTQVQALQEQVELLEASQASLASQVDQATINIVELDNRTDETSASSCLATSDRHYYRESVDGSKKRFRMPVVVWNTSLKTCR